MADHFLSKIRVNAADFVEANGQTLLDRHAEVTALLAERAGPEAAALFAEPLVSHGNDEAPATVSWYTDRPGTARPLESLAGPERDRAERYLADHLRPVRALAEDPGLAPLALGALTTYGEGDVLVVDDRPVIVNWGLMPDGRGANAGARPQHYARTLGRFVPLDAPRAATAAAAPPRAPEAAVAASPVAERRPARITALAWVPLLILLLIAGGVLAWLLMPGTRLFHAGPPPAITDADRLAAVEAENAALRDRQGQLREAIDGAVCRADGQLVLPDGRTPEGLLPPPEGTAPADRAEAAPDALLPSAPERVELGEGTLLDRIEARTVLVLASGPEGVSTGTGLSLGGGYILTNQHVAGEGAEVLVLGAGLAQPVPAEIVKTEGPLAEVGADFSLLRIAETGLPGFALFTGTGSQRLMQVVAAGYPADVLETDASFRALRNGDASAVPGLTVTDGIVNAEQELGSETSVLLHSAALSRGNSGGPLVDMCGRLLGINTYVRKGPLQSRGVALSTSDIREFLQGTGVDPALDDAACAPVVRRAGAE